MSVINLPWRGDIIGQTPLMHDSHQEQVMLLLLLSRDTQQPQQQQGLPDTWTQTTNVSTVILNTNNIDNT